MCCRNFLISLLNFMFPCLNFLTDLTNSYSEDVTDSFSVSELPSCIIVEIISRLPVKSIIQCRRVCKSWYELISDPYFSNIYLKNSPFTIMVISGCDRISDGWFDADFLNFLEIGRNGDVTPITFNPKSLDLSENEWFLKTKTQEIAGSCNGLLCLVETPYVNYRKNQQRVSIINPLLGERMVLPKVDAFELIQHVKYGFGSITVDGSETYKVVRIVIRLPPNEVYRADVWILTVGVDDKWRSLDYFFISYHISDTWARGIALNGVLHWPGANREIMPNSGNDDPHWYHRCVIFAVDMRKEKSYRMLLPIELKLTRGSVLLSTWNECLCVTQQYGDGQFDIWIMQQYGDIESWTKNITVKDWIPFNLRSKYLFPITTVRNGNLLLVSCVHGRNLVSIDQKTMEGCELEFPVDGLYKGLFGYVPKFISLNALLGIYLDR